MAGSEEDRHLKLAGEFDCDATPLATLRHSTSHVMAQAVKRLFPDVTLAIGPAIEDGFYYDFGRAEPFTPDDLARIEDELTSLGLEVDSTEALARVDGGVVVAEVLRVERHPNADRLSVCAVDDGSGEHQVVCGARNVAPGIKAPFARVGAQLPGGRKIGAAELRGVRSNGMLCSAKELGLVDDVDGLLILDAQAHSRSAAAHVFGSPLEILLLVFPVRAVANAEHLAALAHLVELLNRNSQELGGFFRREQLLSH